MIKVKTDLKYLLLIWVTFLGAVFCTYAHHGSLIIDCGREVYYPVRILSGKILYKDLFNIYGPFAYMFNAFLFKLFSVKLNVLYVSGCVCAFAIVNFMYLIAKRFLPEFLSFSIAIFAISTGILNLNLFNFIFPYSYGMLYGFTAFLISFYFLLNYLDKSDNKLYIYLSCFFAGLCITSKYEFVPYLVVISYVILKTKPFKFIEWYYTIFSLIFIPVFCFGLLFFEGLRFADIVSAVLTLKKVAQCHTLKYFYLTQGIYFHKNTINVMFLNILRTLLPLVLLFYGLKIHKKIFSFILIALSVILVIYFTNPVSFVFLPILIFISSIFGFKNIVKNTPLFILIMSSIAISLKSFWGLATLNYGVFFVGFLFIAVSALILERFHGKFNLKIIGTYILIISIILGFQNTVSRANKSCLVTTNIGKIYEEKPICDASNELIEYINLNTKKSDKIVIFPEGMFINFLTQRKSDDYYNSLIPLYFETFGEFDIVNHFNKEKPDYIIFNNWDTKDYYFSHICNDYALGFCYFVAKNYTQQKIIDKGFRYLIFKHK